MYEITRVGVPTRKQDATISFIKAIESIRAEEAIGLVTVNFDNSPFELKAAPYGYSYLIEKLKIKNVDTDLSEGILNCFGNIWNVVSGDTPYDAVKNMVTYFDQQQKKLGFNQIYIFTCGSPYISDMLTSILPQIRQMNIIDCESPIKICSKIMQEYLNLETCKISFTPPVSLSSDTLTVFPGISEHYGINTNEFFNALKTELAEDDMFLYVTLIDDGSAYMKCMNFKQALENVENFIKTDQLITYGVYKK
jgi:hypothetical protein